MTSVAFAVDYFLGRSKIKNLMSVLQQKSLELRATAGSEPHVRRQSQRPIEAFCYLVQTLLLGLLGSTLLSGCLSHHDAGLSLGEEHARELKAHTITLERLDAELKAGEIQRTSEADRTAFVNGYRQGVEPAKAELAKLYVETAATGIGDVARSLGTGIDVLVKGIVDSVDESEETPAPPPKAPDSEARMREMGRHLGRIINGLGEAVKAAADGFMEELGGD